MPDPLNPARLRALLDTASPRPWEAWDKRGRPLYDEPGGAVVGHTGPGDHGVLIPHIGVGGYQSKWNYSMPSVEDDELVAALVNSAPALLTRLAKLERVAMAARDVAEYHREDETGFRECIPIEELDRLRNSLEEVSDEACR